VAVILTMLADDETTTITGVTFSSVTAGSAGETKKAFLKNTGDETSAALTLTIKQSGSDAMHAWLTLYPDDAGSPDLAGAKTTGQPLTIGTIAAGASVPFHLKVVVPGGATTTGHHYYLETGSA
jgi:hypothetical protein